MSKSFEALQKHAINLELDLQQCKEKIKNDKSFKENQSKEFLKEREQYFKIQDLKAQLQDKGITISELKKHIEKMKGKSVETKFEKSLVIRQPNAFKGQRQSILGKPATFSDSLEKKDFSKSNVSRPQLKCNKLEDRVMPNNSQGKKQEVEDHLASDSTNQKPRHTTKKLYEHVSKTCSWWYPKFTPSGYKWKPKSKIGNVNTNLVEIILFIVDSGCSKHMTGNLKLLTNFVEKFLGTVKFGNDQIAPILGYGDLVQGKITIKRVYYVEGLNHNLFSVGQFCDADLEVAFRKSTCYIRDLKGNDLLTGSRGTDLYSITLQDTSTPNPICLMAKATSSQAWLWHRRLSHLNFDTINLLSKNDIVIGLPKLKFVKDHLCSSCELGKAKRKYTWTRFLRSKDEILAVLIDFLTLVQRGLHAQSRAYRVFNKITRVIVETIHVNFDELPQMASDHICSDPVLQCSTMALEHDSLSPDPQSQENVPQAAENGNPSQSIRTRRQLETDGEMCMFALTMSRTEPKIIKESMADSVWIEEMQEELHQFDRLDVWELVDRPICKNVINMKWIWKNKRDKENTVIRNKAHLVAKGYAQKE
ncbi:retrovirus-related pol polyprotein from transposon TNT 1-94 [Tanacetum coccineum]